MRLTPTKTFWVPISGTGRREFLAALWLLRLEAPSCAPTKPMGLFKQCLAPRRSTLRRAITSSYHLVWSYVQWKSVSLRSHFPVKGRSDHTLYTILYTIAKLMPKNAFCGSSEQSEATSPMKTYLIFEDRRPGLAILKASLRSATRVFVALLYWSSIITDVQNITLIFLRSRCPNLDLYFVHAYVS